MVSNLISDVERHLQGSTMELLQDANVIMKRSETLALKKPKSFPKEQRRVFRAPDLREILRVFNGEECYPSGCRRASLTEGKWVGGSNFYVWRRQQSPDTMC